MSRTTVVLMSAGYKYGHPAAGHVFDVTSCPNPRAQAHLRPAQSKALMGGQLSLRLRILAMAVYIRKVGGSEPGVYAICCTGGRDRSPFIVGEVARTLRNRCPKWRIVVRHREGLLE